MKTSAGWEDVTYTTTGQQLTETINGQTITLVVGKECTIPIPQPETGRLSAKSITFTPSEISRISYHDNNVRILQDFSASGKTSNGHRNELVEESFEFGADLFRY